MIIELNKSVESIRIFTEASKECHCLVCISSFTNYPNVKYTSNNPIIIIANKFYKIQEIEAFCDTIGRREIDTSTDSFEILKKFHHTTMSISMSCRTKFNKESTNRKN